MRLCRSLCVRAPRKVKVSRLGYPSVPRLSVPSFLVRPPVQTVHVLPARAHTLSPPPLLLLACSKLGRASTLWYGVYQLAVINLATQSTSLPAHKTLVGAAQMFGAGKTELGNNAVARAALQRMLLKAFPADAVEA